MTHGQFAELPKCLRFSQVSGKPASKKCRLGRPKVVTVIGQLSRRFDDAPSYDCSEAYTNIYWLPQ